jgi:vancomycin resistance protein VanJ
MKRSPLVIKISVTYIVFIFLWLAARLLLGDRFWFLAYLNTITEYFFLPLPFLIWENIYHRTRTLLALMLPLILFFVLWGSQYLPSRVPDEVAEALHLRVMTFNVKSANRSPALLEIPISGELPDLIGFQELSRHNIPALQEAIKSHYLFNTFHLYDGRISDVGFASRFYIVSVERFDFPPRDAAIHAIIDWNGRSVHVFVLHFSADNLYEHQITEIPALERENLADRAVEVTRLEEELSNLHDPVIVLCDCNITDTSETYTRLAGILQDSFKWAGWGPGHTLHPEGFPLPVLRIDYIWYSPEFTAVSSYVGDNQSSDHHPLISVLAFTGNSD